MEGEQRQQQQQHVLCFVFALLLQPPHCHISRSRLLKTPALENLTLLSTRQCTVCQHSSIIMDSPKGGTTSNIATSSVPQVSPITDASGSVFGFTDGASGGTATATASASPSTPTLSASAVTNKLLASYVSTDWRFPREWAPEPSFASQTKASLAAWRNEVVSTQVVIFTNKTEHTQ